MTRGLSTVDACTRRSSWTMVYFRLTVFTQSAPEATYLRPFPLMFGLSRRPHLNAHLTNQMIFESSVAILSLLASPWSWKAVPHCQSVLKPSFHQLVSHSTVVVGAEWKDWLRLNSVGASPSGECSHLTATSREHTFPSPALLFNALLCPPGQIGVPFRGGIPSVKNGVFPDCSLLADVDWRCWFGADNASSAHLAPPE